MTAECRQLVQVSWDAVIADAAPLAQRFYAHVFAIAPGARRLFATTDMAEQERKFTQMLSSIVHALDDADGFVAHTSALAARHVGYGVQDQHYDVVGDALRAALADVLGARFTPATHAAWSEAYALLAAVMRRAAAAYHDDPTVGDRRR